MQNYKNLNDRQKLDTLLKLYVDEKKSINEIADMYSTYANKIRRDLKKLNIPVRDKSEAQKNALKSGKASHPTKGKKRDSETKQKIGKTVMKSWENLSDSELEKRRKTAKKNWEKLSNDEKEHRRITANAAIRETSKLGSKLEQYLQTKLLEAGFHVEPHKENILNTKLHVDLFLPKANIAIEVDGPSHFSPVWGEEALNRAKSYDEKKNGLLIGKGLKLIRVQQARDFSNARGKLIFDRLVEAISKIESGGDKLLYIGDE